MFGDVNRVELMGNITNDPNLRTTPNGANVISFGIATNRRFKSQNEWKEETQFHNIVVWGNQAVSLSQRIKKGTRIYISGRLSTRSWDDKETGKKNYKTEVIADQVILIDRYERGTLNNPDTDKPQESTQSEDVTIDPNELPF